MEKTRTESEVLADLQLLCLSSGFVHAVAMLVFRENIVTYSDELTAEDLGPTYSRERLIRTELSTLIGLMVRQPVNYEHPGLYQVQEYMSRAETLLKELHDTFARPLVESLDHKRMGDPTFNPFTKAEVLREPIFYGGESAYLFQYTNLSRQKYARDREWLLAHKGFSIEQASVIAEAIFDLIVKKQTAAIKELRKSAASDLTMLPGFTFSASELAMGLEDDISADLDVAMAVRREGLPGKRTPDGILTYLIGTPVGSLIRQIEVQAQPAMVPFGLQLLELNQRATSDLNEALAYLVDASRKDGRQHDFTMLFENDGGSGVTIHCSYAPTSESLDLLQAHCHLRKYSQKAKRWYGVVINPHDGSLRFGINLESPWIFDDGLEEATKGMPIGTKNFKLPGTVKLGRNDPCSCGSGKKYKNAV
jgi:hypothetical protein